MFRLTAFIFSLVLASLFIAVQVQAAAEIVVNDDAGGNASEPPPCNDTPDATTVQGGINLASPGDTVTVCPGTYTEDLTIWTDNLTLQGVDMATSIIEAATAIDDTAHGFPYCDGPPIDLQANGVSIENLTIRTPVSTTDERTCGIVLDGANIEIADNYFQVGVGADFSVAIQTWVNGSQGLGDISGLSIHDNHFTNLPLLEDGDRYIGVFINPQNMEEDPDNDVRISHNDLTGPMFFGIASSRGNTEIGYNEVNGAAAGILLDLPNQTQANSVHNNGIGHSTYAGILITSDGNVVFRNTTHHTDDGSGNGNGIEVSGYKNTFEGNNSHHNSDCGYEDDAGNNANTWATDPPPMRNKAKHNGNDDIPCVPAP
jgi:hypothetical protein